MVIKALDPYWIRIRIRNEPKMLDPDPDEMNANPQPWFRVRIGFNTDTDPDQRGQICRIRSCVIVPQKVEFVDISAFHYLKNSLSI